MVQCTASQRQVCRGSIPCIVCISTNGNTRNMTCFNDTPLPTKLKMVHLGTDMGCTRCCWYPWDVSRIGGEAVDDEGTLSASAAILPKLRSTILKGIAIDCFWDWVSFFLLNFFPISLSWAMFCTRWWARLALWPIMYCHNFGNSSLGTAFLTHCWKPRNTINLKSAVSSTILLLRLCLWLFPRHLLWTILLITLWLYNKTVLLVSFYRKLSFLQPAMQSV